MPTTFLQGVKMLGNFFMVYIGPIFFSEHDNYNETITILYSTASPTDLRSLSTAARQGPDLFYLALIFMKEKAMVYCSNHSAQVYDLRATAKVMTTVLFSPGPSFLKFHPRYTDVLYVASKDGKYTASKLRGPQYSATQQVIFYNWFFLNLLSAKRYCI